jgi:hypothetical protein
MAFTKSEFIVDARQDNYADELISELYSLVEK